VAVSNQVFLIGCFPSFFLRKNLSAIGKEKRHSVTLASLLIADCRKPIAILADCRLLMANLLTADWDYATFSLPGTVHGYRNVPQQIRVTFHLQREGQADWGAFLTEN